MAAGECMLLASFPLSKVVCLSPPPPYCCDKNLLTKVISGRKDLFWLTVILAEKTW